MVEFHECFSNIVIRLGNVILYLKKVFQTKYKCFMKLFLIFFSGPKFNEL